MDSSVEYLATREPYRRLLSDAELSVAQSRLDALPDEAFSSAEWSTSEEDYSEGRMGR